MNSLRKRRLAKGWSLRHLGNVAEVTVKTICKIEKDDFVPSALIQAKLASALGCRAEDLFPSIQSKRNFQVILGGAENVDASGNEHAERSGIVSVGYRSNESDQQFVWNLLQKDRTT